MKRLDLQTGTGFEPLADDRLVVVDPTGGQVSDLCAVSAAHAKPVRVPRGSHGASGVSSWEAPTGLDSGEPRWRRNTAKIAIEPTANSSDCQF